MHRALPLIAALAFASPAAAAPGTLSDCTALSQAAHTAMQTRQTGVTMHEVAGALSSSLDGTDLALALAIFEAAYAEPLFSTEEYKVQAANEFASSVYLMCRED